MSASCRWSLTLRVPCRGLRSRVCSYGNVLSEGLFVSGVGLARIRCAGFEVKHPRQTRKCSHVARAQIPLLAARLTTGLVEECLKQTLHGAPPERSLARGRVYQKANERQRLFLRAMSCVETYPWHIMFTAGLCLPAQGRASGRRSRFGEGQFPPPTGERNERSRLRLRSGHGPWRE